ncbi:MAG: deoxynucleoside kinase [Granulosicoccus sp.]|nr:deoxynucleoside kinase [Granulosicoccus sp.]
MKYQFLAVEGPIGVGKTTLAKKLASHFNARLLTDTEDSNPYLGSFYKQQNARAFHTQIHFLVSRLEALNNPEIIQTEQPIVADFFIQKDKLFAELTLDHTEWWMYSTISEQLLQNVPRPDLVVYLQAPLAQLIERIERRGYNYERRIDSHYLEELSALYERYFHTYCDPLLIINTADINLADSEADVSELCHRIAEFRGGRQFYNPQISG